MPERDIVLTNASVLDVVGGELLPRRRVTVRGGTIAAVEPAQAGPVAPGARVIDVQGRTVMPGLCDAHVHVACWTTDLSLLGRTSPAYATARTAANLEAMLLRGFTTVRDAGGADYGLAQAVTEGLLKGPRILYCGHALSQTGGHGDLRARGEETVAGLNESLRLERICDGAAEVRRACRDEIRKGARQIKLMLSGGVVSPTDRLGNAQFSEEEIRAAVEEAEMAGIYCMGHVYTGRAVQRALRCGVRSLEHCNLVDEPTVEAMAERGAFMVPTFSVYDSLAREGAADGFPKELIPKLREAQEAGLRSLEMAHRCGVKLAFGTDLIGRMQKNQLGEFALRAPAQPAAAILRSATCAAAELFNEAGRTGVVAPGARADLLVLDGNPLKDLGCLQDPERCLRAILKDGVFQTNRLESTTT